MSFPSRGWLPSKCIIELVDWRLPVKAPFTASKENCFIVCEDACLCKREEDLWTSSRMPAWCVSQKLLYAFWSAQRLDRERTLHAGILRPPSGLRDRIVNPKKLCSFYLSDSDDWQLKQMYHKDYRFMSQTTNTDVLRWGFKGLLQWNGTACFNLCNCNSFPIFHRHSKEHRASCSNTPVSHHSVI